MSYIANPSIYDTYHWLSYEASKQLNDLQCLHGIDTNAWWNELMIDMSKDEVLNAVGYIGYNKNEVVKACNAYAQKCKGWNSIPMRNIAKFCYDFRESHGVTFTTTHLHDGKYQFIIINDTDINITLHKATTHELCMYEALNSIILSGDITKYIK